LNARKFDAVELSEKPELTPNDVLYLGDQYSPIITLDISVPDGTEIVIVPVDPVVVK
jgi:hypothetical protein